MSSESRLPHFLPEPQPHFHTLELAIETGFEKRLTSWSMRFSANGGKTEWLKLEISWRRGSSQSDSERGRSLVYISQCSLAAAVAEIALFISRVTEQRRLPKKLLQGDQKLKNIVANCQLLPNFRDLACLIVLGFHFNGSASTLRVASFCEHYNDRVIAWKEDC